MLPFLDPQLAIGTHRATPQPNGAGSMSTWFSSLLDCTSACEGAADRAMASADTESCLSLLLNLQSGASRCKGHPYLQGLTQFLPTNPTHLATTTRSPAAVCAGTGENTPELQRGEGGGDSRAELQRVLEAIVNPPLRSAETSMDWLEDPCDWKV
jgi:hypothetical protein